MPKLAKRILVGVAIVVGLACLGLLLLNLYVQSATTTAKIERKLSASLRMPVRITSATFTPWSGLRITGITVPRSEAEGGGNFLEAAAFLARFEASPLFSRKLVISDVTLKEPRLHWVQTKKGKWRLPKREEEPESASPRAEKTAPAAPERAPEPGEPVKPFIVSVHRLQIQNGQLDFLDSTQKPIARFSNVQAFAPSADPTHLEGEATSGHVVIHDRLVFANLKTPFSYTLGDEGILELKGITADVAGGTLAGNFTIQPEMPETPIAVDAQFDYVDLNQLVSDLGGMPGQTAGRLKGALQLAGPTRDTDALRGKGRLHLTNGSFKQYEFLQLLGQVLQIEELTQLNLQTAQAEFHIADSKVWVDQLTLQSPNLKLTATGKIKFNSRLDLAARLIINDRIARQLPRVIEANFTPGDEKGERYIDFEVGGTWQKPKTNLRERIIGKSYEAQAVNLLKSLFGAPGGSGSDKRKEKKEKKMELAPDATPAPILPEPSLPPVPSVEPSAAPSPLTEE